MGVALAALAGFALPLQKGPRGFFKMVTGEDVVKAEILSVIGTEQGERVMRPLYGVKMRRLLFEPDDKILGDLIQHEVTTALGLWVPRIRVLGIDVEIDRVIHLARFPIRYQIKSTGTTDSVDGELQLRR